MAFLESKYLYFMLLAFTIVYPISQSFEYRIQMYKKFKFLGFAISMMMLVFIPWDIYFTEEGIWWFNSSYITEIYIFNLPVEEVLFFIFVPFACVFIYEVLNYFIKVDLLASIVRPFLVLLSICLLFLAMQYSGQLYTFVCFSSTGIALIVILLINPIWLGKFLFAYFVTLIPFLFVNGILTGSLIVSPVVNYNDAEIIGLRILTIPVEDFVYNLLMFLLVIAAYEKSSLIGQPKS